MRERNSKFLAFFSRSKYKYFVDQKCRTFGRSRLDLSSTIEN